MKAFMGRASILIREQLAEGRKQRSSARAGSSGGAPRAAQHRAVNMTTGSVRRLI